MEYIKDKIKELIHKDEKPTLPKGFQERSATINDVPELTSLFNLVSRTIIGNNEISEHEFRAKLETPGFDIVNDTSVILNEEGKIVTYGCMYAVGDLPVSPDLIVRVHLDYMNMGLGTHLHLWAIARAKTVMDRLPEDLRVVALSWVEHKWQTAIDLFENNGMTQSRIFFSMKTNMEEMPLEPSWPTGIELKLYQHPEQAKSLFQAHEDAFRDHHGFVEREFEAGFERFSHKSFNDDGFDPSMWFLAMDGELIAGFSLCRKMGYESQDQGYVMYLAVLPEYRRQGLASSLLMHSFREYYKRNQKVVNLDVDAGSLTGAVDLYRKVGMAPYKQYNQYQIELRPGKDLRRK